ncbi:MAG: GNAT family N-acetyltransferase [Blautia sp.]|jgi:L-amino acid N-acyltransferase YncA
MSIRRAVLEDAGEILKIYGPYIEETTVTFEYEVPSLEEYQERMRRVMEKYPWLVWEEDGSILGYAYAGDFRSRMAFSWDCELSVYLRMDARGRGIGTRLYETLLEILKKQGYVNAYALICVPNVGSERLHDTFGFQEEGLYRGTGYKFHRWLDLSCRVKRLQDPKEPVTLPVRFEELVEQSGPLASALWQAGREEK